MQGMCFYGCAIQKSKVPDVTVYHTFIRVMKGLTPACSIRQIVLNGVYECLRILRGETTASGQAEKQLNKTGEEEKF